MEKDNQRQYQNHEIQIQKPDPIYFNPTENNSIPNSSSKKVHNGNSVKVFLPRFSGFSNWFLYFGERVRLLPTILLGLGYAMSSQYLELDSFFICALCLILHLITLRLMDDLKDLSVDIIAHPERPLPRGLVQKREMLIVIYCLQFINVLFAVLIICLFNKTAFGLQIAIILFQHLMFNEFFVPLCNLSPNHFLHSPLLYAILHQPVIVLYVVFANSFAKITMLSLYLGLFMFSYSFIYEISRKLDLTAHPILKYYLQYYGSFIVIFVYGLLIGLAIWMNILIQLPYWNIAIHGATLLVLILFVLSQRKNTIIVRNLIKKSKDIQGMQHISGIYKSKYLGLVEIIVSVALLWNLFLFPFVRPIPL